MSLTDAQIAERPPLYDLWERNKGADSIARMKQGEVWRVPWHRPIEPVPISRGIVPVHMEMIFAVYRLVRTGARSWSMLGKWSDREEWVRI